MKKIFLFLSLTIVSMFTLMLPSFAKTYYGFGFDIVPKYINNATKMTVSNVVPGSSVAKNDIKNGDVIKEINGKEFATPDFAKIVEALYVNTTLQILLENKSQPIEIIADTPIPEKDITTLKYIGKITKCLTKKKVKEKDIAKARIYLDEAIVNDPNNVYLRYMRINSINPTTNENLNPAQLECLIQDYLAIYNITNDPQYLQAVGYTYLKLQDPQNAEKYYNEVIKIVNTNEIKKNIYSQMSYYHYERNDMNYAQKWFDKLIPLANNEEKLKIYYTVAEKYKDNYQIDKAITYYNKYISLTTSKEEKQAIYATIANYYSTHSEYTKAINYWTKFLQTSTTNKEKITAYQNITDLYDRAKNYNLAVQNAQKILTIDSKDVFAIKYMAAHYLKNNNYSACIPYVTKLIYLEPYEQYTYYLERAILYDKLGNITNSCKDAEVVYNGSSSREQKMTALFILVEANEKRIVNSLKNNKDYFKTPSWKELSPATYTYVIGDEGSIAQYWADRRTNFYKGTQSCMSKYSGTNLTKCYADIVKNEEQLNNKYYYMVEVQRQQQERNMEYMRQQALLREQYNNQRMLQNQLINGLYRVQTAPQNYNVNVNGTMYHDVNVNGTMWHHYGY